jgi:hypothetical protein
VVLMQHPFKSLLHPRLRLFSALYNFFPGCICSMHFDLIPNELHLLDALQLCCYAPAAIFCHSVALHLLDALISKNELDLAMCCICSMHFPYSEHRMVASIRCTVNCAGRSLLRLPYSKGPYLVAINLSNYQRVSAFHAAAQT